MRDDHPLAERKTITPEEIAAYPLTLDRVLGTSAQ